MKKTKYANTMCAFISKHTWLILALYLIVLAVTGMLVMGSRGRLNQHLHRRSLQHVETREQAAGRAETVAKRAEPVGYMTDDDREVYRSACHQKGQDYSSSSSEETSHVCTNRTLRRDADPLHALVQARRLHAAAIDAAAAAQHKQHHSNTATRATQNCSAQPTAHCCARVSDCALCRALRDDVSRAKLELLTELMLVLGEDAIEDAGGNPCADLESVDTSCIVTPYSWKL